MRQRVNPIQAEARAVEFGLRAMAQPDGTFSVRSVSRPNQKWTVRIGIVRDTLKASCECESGTARPSEMLPCLHSAAVLRRLERIGWARWEAGYFKVTDKALDAMRRAS